MLQLSNWFRGNRDIFVRYANMLAIWTLITIMVAGGFGMGFVISQSQIKPMMAQHETHYNAEINRLSDVYADSLFMLGYRTLEAAKTAEHAAVIAAKAASEAKDATTTSATAVRESKRSVAASKPSESNRIHINRSIDKANQATK